MKATPQTEYQTCSSPWKALPYTCALSSSHSLSQTTPDLLSFITCKFSLFQNSLRAVYSVVHGSFHSARAFRDLLCCCARQWCAPYFREHSVVWLYQFVPRGLVSQIRLLRTFVCKSWWGDVVCSFVLFGEIPRSDLEESRRVWKTIREIVFHNDLWFYPPVSNVGEFQLLHILVNASYCCSL